MNRYTNFLPDSYKDYKVSYDNKLKYIGNSIFEMLDSAEKLQHTHSHNGNWFRKALTTGGILRQHSEIYSKSEIEHIETTLYSYLGIESIVRQFKIEEQKYSEGTVDGNKYFSRVDNIKPNQELNFEYTQECHHGSSWWHTDTGCERSNIVLVIYLTDVTAESCPLHISNPYVELEPVRDSNTPKTVNKYTTESIPQDIITGPAGTVVCFSSHHLHRGSFCQFGTSRKSIHLNLHLNEDKYTCEPYIKSHFE